MVRAWKGGGGGVGGSVLIPHSRSFFTRIPLPAQFFMNIPNPVFLSQKNTFKSQISTKAKEQIVNWPSDILNTRVFKGSFKNLCTSV